MVVKLVGVDLATVPERCGVCVIENSVVTYVGQGAARATHPEWLVEYCSEAAVVAIDVPFGWPVSFIRDLRGYKIGAALDRHRRRYTYRATDAWIADTLPELLQRSIRPPRPLSVSADRIGATAMVGTLLLNCLSSTSFSICPWRDRDDPSVLEVYRLQVFGPGVYLTGRTSTSRWLSMRWWRLLA
jgi:Protein of unknown function (DUF429)